jgi:maleylpyruvate isomerase
MKLFGYWRSGASWRVRIALHLKQLRFESVAVHLLRDGGEQRSADYRARNPMEQVPVLELEDETGTPRRLTQSLPIIEYLDECHPEPPLLPEGRWDRFRARQIAEICNSGMQPLHNLRVLQAVDALGGDRRAWVQPFLQKGVDALNALVEPGPYALGDRPTLADICLVPQLYSVRRFGLDLSGAARLVRVEEACHAHPAFRAAHPDAQEDAQAPAK